MVYGLGCDLVDIERIKKALSRQPKFSDNVLSEEERLVYDARRILSEARGIRYLASRWAAKEAFSKSIGTGFRGPVNFADVSVLNNELGAPYLEFKGALAVFIENLGLKFQISLSDTDSAAMAVVICEKE